MLFRNRHHIYRIPRIKRQLIQYAPGGVVYCPMTFMAAAHKIEYKDYLWVAGFFKINANCSIYSGNRKMLYLFITLFTLRKFTTQSCKKYQSRGSVRGELYGHPLGTTAKSMAVLRKKTKKTCPETIEMPHSIGTQQ